MEKLAVIGCGTMGHSIALNAAWAGISVKMFGINEADRKRGTKQVGLKLKFLHDKGLIDQDEINRVKQRISTTSSYAEVMEGSSFVIETIPEDLDLKKELFEQLGSLCGKGVILASNTSGLSPSFFISSLPYPQRFLVTHFWNPAHLIPLVEVVPSEKTSENTLKRTLALLKVMNKKPIVLKKEVPGFVANRLQFALFREAQFLLEEGIASKEDIDAAVTYSFGRRLSVTGPLVSADMGGLDIFSSISDYLFGSLSNAGRSLPVLKGLVEKGKFGSKTESGFYDWSPSFLRKMNLKREIELIRHLDYDLKIKRYKK